MVMVMVRSTLRCTTLGMSSFDKCQKEMNSINPLKQGLLI
jgi:hypothetical protein